MSGHCLFVRSGELGAAFLWYRDCVQKLLIGMRAFHNMVEKQLHQCVNVAFSVQIKQL